MFNLADCFVPDEFWVVEEMAWEDNYLLYK